MKRKMMMKRTIILPLLALSLTATAQKLTPVQSTVDCGQVIFRHPVTVNFEVKNNTLTPALVQKVRKSCGCTTVNLSKSAVPAGQSMTVATTLDANQLGHFEKQVGIYCIGDTVPTLLTLRGVVVSETVDFQGNYNCQIGELKADKNDIEFDDVNRGDRPVQKIYILNTTQEKVEPVVMHLPNYLKATVSPSSLAPGQQGVVALTLDSRKLHDYGLTQTSVFLGKYPGDQIAANKEIDVSAILLPAFQNMTEYEISHAPHYVASAQELNLGKFGTKNKLKGMIEIRNDGKLPLQISSIQMFTEGIEVSLSDKNIQSGQSAKLKVTAFKHELRKARRQPRILMITNDPEHGKVVIPIKTE